jgi:hypothetical protein
LKRPSWGIRFSDLDAGNDRAVVPLVDRVHGLVEHAVDAVLDDDDVLLGLDVDVRGAALDRVEHHGVDELDDRRGVLRDPVDREGLFSLLVLGDELHAEVLGGLVEDALRGLALLEDVGDRGAAADLDAQRHAHQELELVQPHDVRRVRADDRQRLLRAALGYERVAQHPLHGNRAEELRVHPERAEVHVGQPQPLRQRDRLRLFFGARRELDLSVQLFGHGVSSGFTT